MLIKLKPQAPFHLGERGIGLEETNEIVHSDTIFGALCWCWTLLTGRSAHEFVEPFLEGRPPFLLSSAFPYVHDLLLVPRPLVELPVQGDREFRRRAQNTDFISMKLLEHLGREPVPQNDVTLCFEERLMVLSSEKPLLDSQRPWTVVQVPRVALDRITSASEIYHTGRLTFAQGCGLYLLVRVLDPHSELTRALPALFRVLGDEGLGGERSCGYGFFEPEEHEITLNIRTSSDRKLLLSLYNPKDQDELSQLDLSQSTYHLVCRRSWIFSPHAKNLQTRAITYFVEGSVLRSRSSPRAPGRLIEVLSPSEGAPHSVYRYGFGFWIEWSGGLV